MFSFIMVDEYQDTKAIQYFIIGEILRTGKTGVFIVGDPNQAIYGSLGGFAIKPADFSAMAGIPLKEMPLSSNYRSSERVIRYFQNYAVRPVTLTAASENKDYPSVITFDQASKKEDIEHELTRLIKYNIEVAGIAQNEICVLAPQWVHLASMTRQLMALMPQYRFDGPGMVPFSRDQDNFWYKLAKIALTEPSPGMYVSRRRWAADVLAHLRHVGVHLPDVTQKTFLRECNSVDLAETDGLTYLKQFFDALFSRLGANYAEVPTLLEHHNAFFADSQARVERLLKDGNAFIGDIESFKKVFAQKSGVTVSTIHGVKGAEYDAVIAYALLDGMVPHFSDEAPDESALKLLYVICSRARKNLHLISERHRFNVRGYEYQPTTKLLRYTFAYDDHKALP
jgi:DNA helicase II / ATP-dependent DNA helicase PcrA